MKKIKNFYFRLMVCKTILTGNFFVISQVKYDGTWQRFQFRIRSLGLPNDKIRKRLLEDARNYYVQKSDRVKRG